MSDLESKKNLPWVLIEIAGVVYAIPCELVLSLHPLNHITRLPRAPESLRGVIDFRGQIIELINIQKLLGLASVEDEVKAFFDLMDARRQDHINWINTLETCVRNGTPFTLTTDPHKCAFGKWYDSYDISNANIIFSTAFSRFDKPHKAIHEIGIKADALIKSGKKEEALALIETTKNTQMQQMMNLFDDVKEAFKESNREITIVIGDGKKNISIAVKKIVAIEYLNETSEELLEETMTKTKYLLGIGKRKNNTFALLLNDDLLLNEFTSKSDKL